MPYQIIATLGPASQTEAIWTQMVSVGVNGFRLNTSHLSLVQLRQWLERLAPYLSALSPQPALVLDLQGSKWRLGELPTCELAEGQHVRLVQASESTQPGVLPVPHADFFTALPLSSREVVLNDAKVRLWIETAGAEGVTARVVQAGPLSAHKGITFASSEYRQEDLHEKDRLILAETQALPFIQYAVSYIKDGLEMQRFRRLAGPTAHLVAKLERQPALDEAHVIAASADQLWLCRGDLGAELGLKGMAEQVHRFSQSVAGCPRPVLMAGQVLEHMTHHATPTRSEVCFLYDCLSAGYAGFVLSDETAIGDDPVESCRTAALFL